MVMADYSGSCEPRLIVNQEFDRFKDFEDAMASYSRRNHTLFVKGNSSRSKHVEGLYDFVVYVCKRGGRQKTSVSRGIRRVLSSFKCGCPVMIRLVSVRCPTSGTVKYRITKLILDHNHDVSEAAYKSYPENRRAQLNDTVQSLLSHMTDDTNQITSGSDSGYFTTEESCTCKFFVNLNLQCRHMFDLKAQLSTSSDQAVAPDHRFSQQGSVSAQIADPSHKTLSLEEKYRAADNLMNQYSTFLSLLGTDAFHDKMRFMETLLKHWEKNQDVDLHFDVVDDSLPLPVPSSSPVASSSSHTSSIPVALPPASVAVSPLPMAASSSHPPASSPHTSHPPATSSHTSPLSVVASSSLSAPLPSSSFCDVSLVRMKTERQPHIKQELMCRKRKCPQT